MLRRRCWLCRSEDRIVAVEPPEYVELISVSAESTGMIASTSWRTTSLIAESWHSRLLTPGPIPAITRSSDITPLIGPIGEFAATEHLIGSLGGSVVPGR